MRVIALLSYEFVSGGGRACERATTKGRPFRTGPEK